MHWIEMIFQTTAVRVAVTACVVCLLVQLCKRFAPNLLSGYVAIAANVVVSAAGVWMVEVMRGIGTDPSQVFSGKTLTELLAVAVTAAAIHGTSKDLSKSKTADPQQATMAKPQGMSKIIVNTTPTGQNPLNTTPSDPQLKPPVQL